MQVNHKANEERKNCISEINDVQGHAENLRSRSRQDFNNSLSPRRFATFCLGQGAVAWWVIGTVESGRTFGHTHHSAQMAHKMA